MPLQLQSSASTKSLEVAKTQIGVKEQGYNRGKIVSQYIKTGGGTIGQSWCMYFVYWCYNEASKLLKIKNPLLRTGSCAAQLKYANSKFSGMKVIKVNGMFFSGKINSGAIAIFKKGTIYNNDIGKLWLGHTGILEKQINNNTFQLIEGNTNATGSRNGDGVYTKIRNKNNSKLPILAFIEV